MGPVCSAHPVCVSVTVLGLSGMYWDGAGGFFVSGLSSLVSDLAVCQSSDFNDKDFGCCVPRHLASLRFILQSALCLSPRKFIGFLFTSTPLSLMPILGFALLQIVTGKMFNYSHNARE